MSHTEVITEFGGDVRGHPAHQGSQGQASGSSVDKRYNALKKKTKQTQRRVAALSSVGTPC